MQAQIAELYRLNMMGIEPRSQNFAGSLSLSQKQIEIMREELDIDDEMNETEEKNTEDDPYFLLAQRLANAPQAKVNANVQEEGEVIPGTAEKDFDHKCPVCGWADGDIIKHFREAHRDVEGVVCPHCYKLLSKKCTLNRHIEQVHLGLQIFKPAKCDECGKVFSKKGHLDRHVRTIHMGMKDESEPCPHCGKIFTTKSSLEPHIEAVHKGVRRKCQICGKVLSDLWKHMRTVHGQYRRKIKIPKEEIFATVSNGHSSSGSDVMANLSLPNLTSLAGNFEFVDTSAETGDFEEEQNPLAVSVSFGVGQNVVGNSSVKASEVKSPLSVLKSPNKRKSSAPLKVKMPFKMVSHKTKEESTEEN